MDRSKGRSADGERTVRTYQPGDAERFRSLYEAVWDTEKRREWFDWRFGGNPRADDVDMVVAEEDGELVGAEPLVPYRLRAGDRTIDAYQPVDWIVHPDHRREGVFTDMTEYLLEYAAEDAALLFNFPNEQLRPGIERFGWEVIDTVAARYRVHDAQAAVAAGSSDGDRSRIPTAALASASDPVVRGGLRLLDRVGSVPDEVRVDRVEGVPVDTVHELYREHVPGCLHVPRDRSYLEWRFANPRWETTTYVACRAGSPVASVVVAVESIGGTRLARLLDVQPMTDEQGDPEAFGAILGAVVADYADADVIKAPPGRYPEVCRRYGFFRGDGFPFSRVSSTTFHAVRLLDGGVDGDGSTRAASDDGVPTASLGDDSGIGDTPGVPSDEARPRAGTGAESNESSEGTIADGSGMATDSDGEERSSKADPGAVLSAGFADETRTVDLTEPGDWLLALGDRDVA